MRYRPLQPILQLVAMYLMVALYLCQHYKSSELYYAAKNTNNNHFPMQKQEQKSKKKKQDLFLHKWPSFIDFAVLTFEMTAAKRDEAQQT